MKQAETNIRPKYTRSHIPNAVFYIPFGYYYIVRLGTLPKLLSWILIYIVPTAFYAAIPHAGSLTHFTLSYLLVLLATFSLYECGYIFNDTISIRKEKQPALRLYPANFEHFNQRKYLIFGSRLFYALMALTGLHFLGTNNHSLLMLCASLLLMCLLFALYNAWRNRYNVWLYPFLVCSRYIPFMLLSQHDWWIYLLLFVSFPLLNALERFSMPRYRWPIMRILIPSESSKTLFRACYYGIVLLIACPLMVLSGHSIWLLSPIILLGIYRVGLLFWLRKHQPTNYLNG